MTGLPAIRAIGAGDAPALLPLVDALNAEPGDPPAGKPAADLARLLAAGRLFGFAADLRDAVVGYALGHDAVTMEVLEPGSYLCDLYVRPHRRRQGIARRLIDAFAAETARRGGTHVWWMALPSNGAAQAAYRACGAVCDPMTAHAIFGPPFDAAVVRAGIRPAKPDMA